MRTFVAFAVAVAFTLGFAPSAVAAGPAKTPAEDAAMAKEHYKKGTKLYDLGKYDEAIVEFEAAYEIKDEPVLLYNIAQAYRLANKYPEALRFYRSYERKFTSQNKKDPPNKSEVDAKITDMENLIAQQNKVANSPPPDAIEHGQKVPTTTGGAPVTTAPVETTEPPQVATNQQPAGNEGREKVESPPPAQQQPPAAETPRPGRTKIIAGIAIAAVGVVAVGAGVAMGLLASSAGSTQMANQVFDPNLESSGKLDGTIGLALDAAGGALIVAGVVVAVLGVRQNAQATRDAQAEPREKAVSFVPSLSHNYAGGTLRLRF